MGIFSLVWSLVTSRGTYQGVFNDTPETSSLLLILVTSRLSYLGVLPPGLVSWLGALAIEPWSSFTLLLFSMILH